MHIELMIVDGCPHADSAYRLFRQSLADVGLGHVEIETTVVASDEDAERRGFTGSPSFFADGHDLLPDPTVTPAVACRLYRGTAGVTPLPDARRLRQALEEHSG
jgi:hypothetical protein